MANKAGRSGELSRGAGWTVLVAVAILWIVLARWMRSDECDVACVFLGRRALPLFFWVASLAAVPGAAWLLVGGYQPDDEGRVKSVAAALATKLLYLFSAAMLWIAIYAAIHVVAEVARLPFDAHDDYSLFRAGTREDTLFAAGFMLVWCALIAFVTLVAARRLDASLEHPASQAPLWLAAGLIASVAFVGAVTSWMEMGRELQSVNDPRLYDDEDDDDDAVARPEETVVTAPPSPSPSARPALGYLPVTIAHERSGYRIFDPRIQIKVNRTGETRYRITFAGVWTAAGKPGHQRCDYTFIDGNNRPVLIRDVGFELSQRAGVFHRFNAATFSASDMHAKPARAKITCYDSRL